jgi:hypothetical protein
MRRLLAILSLFAVAGCGPQLQPLPASEAYPNAATALIVIINRGLRVVPVLGTGSMAPWIPAHPLGSKIIVAYAGLDSTPYTDLKSGDVVVYSRYGQRIIHRRGEQDSRGFLAFGIANEYGDRNPDGGLGFVTPYNFVGRVASVALFPLKN